MADSIPPQGGVCRPAPVVMPAPAPPALVPAIARLTGELDAVITHLEAAEQRLAATREALWQAYQSLRN